MSHAKSRIVNYRLIVHRFEINCVANTVSSIYILHSLHFCYWTFFHSFDYAEDFFLLNCANHRKFSAIYSRNKVDLLTNGKQRQKTSEMWFGSVFESHFASVKGIDRLDFDYSRELG